MSRHARARVQNVVAVALCVAAGSELVSGGAHAQVMDGTPAALSWTIPSTAASEHNPLTLTPELLAKGRSIYAVQCQHCHGTEGRNDGPDSDRDAVNGDLTDAFRIDINPDGIVFYKIWNGRYRPRMPGFSTVLSKDDVWAVVAYVQTLRRPAQH